MMFISGKVFWIILDPETNEMVMRCDSRDEARALAKGAGIVLRVERVR